MMLSDFEHLLVKLVMIRELPLTGPQEIQLLLMEVHQILGIQDMMQMILEEVILE